MTQKNYYYKIKAGEHIDVYHIARLKRRDKIITTLLTALDISAVIFVLISVIRYLSL